MGISWVGGLGLLGEFPPIVCLSLGRWDIPDGFEESNVVEPVHPLQGGQFQGLPGFPRAPAMDLLGFVQPLEGLGQGVVIAVSTTAPRGFNDG